MSKRPAKPRRQEDQKSDSPVTTEQMMRIGLAALSERVRVLEEAVASIGINDTTKKGLFAWLTSKKR